MLKLVYDMVSKLNAELWLYALIGVIALVFIVGLVLTLITGDAVKFSKGAKLFLKNPDPRNATATAAKMPLKVRKAFKRVGKTGEKPSDVISVDTCVNAPHATSVGSKLTKAVLFTTLILTVISFYIAAIAKPFEADSQIAIDVGMNYLYVLPITVGLVGLVLVFLAGIVSTLHYNGLIKTYNAYVDKLDALSKGGNFDGDIAVPVATANSTANEHVVVNDYSEQVIEERSSDDRFKTFETPTRLDIAIEEDEEDNTTTTTVITETVTVTETVSEPKNSTLNEIDEEIRIEREAEERRREEARQEAIEKAKAMAEEKRRQAMEASANQAVVTPAPSQTAQESAGSSSADVIIARIEQISKEGVPLPTMKEVALQLQQERAKPENKTPETQKRLNESLSLLLKSMSSATRK